MNFGTFSSMDAYVLKPELEKRGVTVKLLYPGTEISPDALANANYPELTLLVEGKDFGYAHKMCQKLGIRRVKNMMRFNKSDSNVGLYIIILIIVAVSALIFSSLRK
jgi:hypothetical protein